MHFMIIAKDADAADTLERRMHVRQEHMQGIKQRKADGSIVDGGAILDDAGTMCGSAVLCEFEDRAALDRYLEEEVYVRTGVWDDIQVYPLRRIDWDALMRD